MAKQAKSKEVRQPLLKKFYTWRQPQQTKSVGKNEICVAKRCRNMAARLEKYRTLNDELTQEVAALRTSERCNREYQIMFDRFTLKFAQCVPRVQVLKKCLEESYYTLHEMEDMVNCFSNPDRLRSFLLGEESFNFGRVGTADSEAVTSPLVKEAPPREHRRFDENGEMDTIIEEHENSAQVDPEISNATAETTAIELESETDSEEQSVIQPSPRVSAHGRMKTASNSLVQDTEEEPDDEDLQIETMAEERKTAGSRRLTMSMNNSSIASRRRRSSAHLPEPPVIDIQRRNSCRSSTRRGHDKTSSSQKKKSLSSTENSEYRLENTFEDEPGTSVVAGTSLRNRSKARSGQSSRDENLRPIASTIMAMNETIPVAGKSDEDFSQCADSTTLLSDCAEPTVVPQNEVIAERSPTAINVAQIWAGARAALPPAERSPTCTTVGAAWLEALQTVRSPSNSGGTSLLAPLATTMLAPNPSPQLQVLPQGLRIPTSTPAANYKKLGEGFVSPSLPKLSIIEPLPPPTTPLDEDKLDSVSQAQNVNVDRRPRKRKADALTVASRSARKGALRVSNGVRGNFAGQTGPLTKTVRFSNVHMENATQQTTEALQYSPPSTSNEPRNLFVTGVHNGGSESPSLAVISSPLVKGPRAMASKSNRKQRMTSNYPKAATKEETESLSARSRRTKKLVNYSELSPSLPISGTENGKRFAKAAQTEVAEDAVSEVVQKSSTEKAIVSAESPLAKRARPLIPDDSTSSGDAVVKNVFASTNGSSSSSASSSRHSTFAKECTISTDASSIASRSSHCTSASDSVNCQKNRSSRRASATVSYAEPSLKAKMRRK